MWVEGFETQIQPAGQQCVLQRVLQDRADLCTSDPGGAILSPGWTFQCTMLPHQGGVFYGSQSGWSTLHFDVPVRRFGAWMGTNAWPASDPGNVTVRMYDLGGALIATVQADVSADCTWTWNGWESSGQPIALIELVNSTHGGAFVHLDEMRAEPDLDAVGMRYCSPAEPNSTGAPGRIFGAGSSVAALNDLTLFATDLPPTRVFALVVLGPEQGFLPGWGGGQGNLCIGNPFVQLWDRLRRTSPQGTVNFPIDLTQLPPPAPPVVTAGDRLNFQVWYRDFNPGDTSNFTDALALTFL